MGAGRRRLCLRVDGRRVRLASVARAARRGTGRGRGCGRTCRTCCPTASRRAAATAARTSGTARTPRRGTATTACRGCAVTAPDPLVRDDGAVDTPWPSGSEGGQARGSLVRSRWERGPWPFGTLTYSRDRLVLRGLVYRCEITRGDFCVIGVQRTRLPYWRTLLWFDGIFPPIAFVPYRTTALLRELERLDWPVVRRVARARPWSPLAREVFGESRC